MKHQSNLAGDSWLVGSLAGWLAGWLVGWLAGWLADRGGARKEEGGGGRGAEHREEKGGKKGGRRRNPILKKTGVQTPDRPKAVMLVGELCCFLCVFGLPRICLDSPSI